MTARRERATPGRHLLHAPAAVRQRRGQLALLAALAWGVVAFRRADWLAVVPLVLAVLAAWDLVAALRERPKRGRAPGTDVLTVVLAVFLTVGVVLGAVRLAR